MSLITISQFLTYEDVTPYSSSSLDPVHNPPNFREVPKYSPHR